MLPTDPAKRKALPLLTGSIDYFPRALAAIAETSKAGNDQHFPGKPLVWVPNHSNDQTDSLGRHLVQRGTTDQDGILHTAKMAWRACANLELELEAREGSIEDVDWEALAAALGRVQAQRIQNEMREDLIRATGQLALPLCPECGDCRFDIEKLGRYGCPNCHGEGLRFQPRKFPCPNGVEDDCGYPACAHAVQCERAVAAKREEAE